MVKEKGAPDFEGIHAYLDSLETPKNIRERSTNRENAERLANTENLLRKVQSAIAINSHLLSETRDHLSGGNCFEDDVGGDVMEFGLQARKKGKKKKKKKKKKRKKENKKSSEEKENEENNVEDEEEENEFVNWRAYFDEEEEESEGEILTDVQTHQGIRTFLMDECEKFIEWRKKHGYEQRKRTPTPQKHIPEYLVPSNAVYGKRFLQIHKRRKRNPRLNESEEEESIQSMKILSPTKGALIRELSNCSMQSDATSIFSKPRSVIFPRTTSIMSHATEVTVKLDDGMDYTMSALEERDDDDDGKNFVEEDIFTDEDRKNVSSGIEHTEDQEDFVNQMFEKMMLETQQKAKNSNENVSLMELRFEEYRLKSMYKEIEGMKKPGSEGKIKMPNENNVIYSERGIPTSPRNFPRSPKSPRLSQIMIEGLSLDKNDVNSYEKVANVLNHWMENETDLYMDLSSDSLTSKEFHDENDKGSAAGSNSFDEGFSDPLHSPMQYSASAFSVISGNETSPIRNITSPKFRSSINFQPPNPRDLPNSSSPFSDGFSDHHFENWENAFQPLPELPSHENKSIPVNRKINSKNTARKIGTSSPVNRLTGRQAPFSSDEATLESNFTYNTAPTTPDKYQKKSSGFGFPINRLTENSTKLLNHNNSGDINAAERNLMMQRFQKTMNENRKLKQEKAKQSSFRRTGENSAENLTNYQSSIPSSFFPTLPSTTSNENTNLSLQNKPPKPKPMKKLQRKFTPRGEKQVPTFQQSTNRKLSFTSSQNQDLLSSSPPSSLPYQSHQSQNIKPSHQKFKHSKINAEINLYGPKSSSQSTILFDTSLPNEHRRPGRKSIVRSHDKLTRLFEMLEDEEHVVANIDAPSYNDDFELSQEYEFGYLGKRFPSLEIIGEIVE